MSGNYQKCGHNFNLKRYSVRKGYKSFSINGLGNLNLTNTERLIGLTLSYETEKRALYNLTTNSVLLIGPSSQKAKDLFLCYFSLASYSV
jgi:hypothetical protein